MKLFDRIVVFNTVLVALVFALSFVKTPQDLPLVSLPSISLPKVAMPKFSLPKVPEVAFAFDFDFPSSSEPQVAGEFTEAIDEPEEPEPTAVPTATPTPTPIPIADPVKVDIPSLQVSADIVHVGVTPDNVMEIPTDYSTVGWYHPGGKPGEEGSAILNGHFDDALGNPAVFHRLKDLAAGTEIIVTTSDNKKYIFSVEDVYSHPFDAFPVDIIYGDEENTSLKLLTCDGVWDPSQKNYSNRLVVIANLSEVREP